MGACTTRYWSMSGRLDQELNVCTVPIARNAELDFFSITFIATCNTSPLPVELLQT